MEEKKKGEETPKSIEQKEGQNLLGAPKFKQLENGRFKCVETGHELPAHATDAYSQSKHCRLGLIDYALARNKPPLNMFNQDPLSSSKLVCKLTGVTINKSEEHIWKRMNGKRFLNMLDNMGAGKDTPNGVVEKQDRIKDKVKSKKKKIKKEEKQIDEVINEVRDSAEKSSDAESEYDFWMPPEGKRWDHDDGGDRWDSDSESDGAGEALKERTKAISTEQLQEDLRQKDAELMHVTSELSKATYRLSELRKEKADLRSQIESSQKRFEEQLSQKESSARTEGLSEGVARGVQLCRERLFLTSTGQAFLKSLHTGLIEAYKKSVLYVWDMGPHIGHYVKAGFKSAQSQATAQGFSGTFDVRASLKGMTPSPQWKGDVNESPDHPYWLPVMREAVQKFVSSEDLAPPFPATSDMIYDVSSEVRSSVAPIVPSTVAVPRS